MKTINSLIAFTIVCAALFSCTKTETVFTPDATIIPGNIVSNGDTTYVSSSNVTFRVTRTSPCNPSNEIFYDSITFSNFPSNAEYKWDFGDGGTATGKFVQHIYEYWNVYTMKLSVYVNGVLQQVITTSVKPYGQHATPFAVFGCQLNDYRNPNYVAFNAQSSITTGSIINYFWDWKDGTTSSVATSYTEHLFPERNVDMYYKVKMTATSHAGCKSSFDDSVIFVPASYTNVGGITYTKSNACAPDSEIVTFVQDTIGFPSNAKFEWDLGEGVRYWGNPLKHHFVYTKTYPIICYIHIPSANGTIVRTVTRNTSVYALGSDINPTPYLNKLIYLNAPINNYIEFDGWGKVGDGHIINKLVWDFGDGFKDSSNTPYAFHQYVQPYPVNNTYNVRLTVTASSGCTGTNIFPVKVGF